MILDLYRLNVKQNDFRKPAISYQQSAISLGKGIEKRRALREVSSWQYAAKPWSDVRVLPAPCPTAYSRCSVLSTRYSVLLNGALLHALCALLFPNLRKSAVNFLRSGSFPPAAPCLLSAACCLKCPRLDPSHEPPWIQYSLWIELLLEPPH